MKKTKIACKSLLFLATVFLLSGCSDREELEDKAYVIGLGLEHSKAEDKIKVTMLIANPEVGSVQEEGVHRKNQEKSSHLMRMISYQRKAQPMW